MLPLPAYVTTHAGDATQVVPYLVQIGPYGSSSYFRWTDFGHRLYWNSLWWEPSAVRVSGLSLTAYDATECNIELGDTNDDFAWADLGTAKGLSGVKVLIYELWLSPTDFSVQAAVTKFKGRIEQVSITDAGVSITVGGYVNLGSKRLPRWIAGANCPFVFKDARCQYAGADTSCTKTWSDCGSRTGGSNQVHFGGFRNLPPTGMKIYWNDGVWQFDAPPPRDGGGGGGGGGTRAPITPRKPTVRRKRAPAPPPVYPTHTPPKGPPES